MNVFYKTFIVLICLHFSTFDLCIAQEGSHTVSPTKHLVSLLIKKGTNKLLVQNIPEDALHLLLQVHSPLKSVSLSFSNKYDYSTAKNGSHIGLVSILQSYPLEGITFYIFSTWPDTTVWINVKTFTIHDPIPGGCNMEFNLEDDANLLVANSSFPLWRRDLLFALGSIWLDDGRRATCDNSLIWEVTAYHLYVLPLAVAGGQMLDGRVAIDTVNRRPITSEDVIEAVRIMSDVKTLMTKAQLLDSFYPTSHQQSEFPLARRLATAQVVAIVMEFSHNTDDVRHVSYVPQVMYGCEEAGSTDCLFLPELWGTILFVGVSVLGLAIALLGHRWPKTQGLLSLGLLVCIVSFVVAQQLDNGNVSVLVLGIVCGLALPVVMILGFGLCRCYTDATRLATFPTVLVLGLLLVAGLFFTPFGDLALLRDLSIFIPVVALGINLLIVVLMPFKNVALSLSTTGVGIYICLAGISLAFLPGSLFHYVAMDLYLRMALPQYLNVLHYTPMGILDVALLSIWLVISLILGIVIAYRLSRRDQSGHRSMTRVVPMDTTYTEDDPLLFDRRQPPPAFGFTANKPRTYGAVSQSQIVIPTAPAQVYIPPELAHTGLRGAPPV